jgi:four helix bundle protein
VKLVRCLPKDVAGNVVARQLARSGMSIGANLEEAQAAQTRKEFQRKINIAKGEARETLYWLRLLIESELIAKQRIEYLITEADEILRIITTILLNSRKNDESRT